MSTAAKERVEAGCATPNSVPGVHWVGRKGAGPLNVLLQLHPSERYSMTIWKHIYSSKVQKMFLFYTPTSVTNDATAAGKFWVVFWGFVRGGGHNCVIYFIYFKRRFA